MKIHLETYLGYLQKRKLTTTLVNEGSRKGDAQEMRCIMMCIVMRQHGDMPNKGIV